MVKRKRFVFWFCGHQKYQKHLSSQNTIHNHPQHSPKFCNLSSFLCGRHKYITPYFKTYCYYSIVQRNNMQMGKNLVVTCSKLIKLVRSYQISYLLLDLYPLTNNKLVFFQSQPIISLNLFQQETLHENNVFVAKKSASLSHKK